MKTSNIKIDYPPDAYKFVQEAVSFAIKNIGEIRHVSAMELLENCKFFAEQQYGFMYSDVLRSWHINCADDIGSIVYELIAANKLSASPGDSREDFAVDFDLFDKNLLRVSCRCSHQPLIID